MRLEHVFSASWVKGRPAYWVKGVRVARAVGYQYAIDTNQYLPEQFVKWHKENDKEAA